MDKLKVVIPIKENYRAEVGGGFSYYSALIKKIDDYSFNEQLDVCFLAESTGLDFGLSKRILHIPKEQITKQHWTLQRRFKRKLRALPVISKFKRHIIYEQSITNRIRESLVTFLQHQKVDLIYYPTPTYTIKYEYPHIMTHWDLGHKSMYAFPEVSLNQEFKIRESYHRVNLSKALAVFTESQKSKQELIHYERLNPSRIFIVPMFAGGVSSLSVKLEKQNQILDKWQLKPSRFFFYPAQFWAHKNHYNLIRAFEKVKEQEKDIRLVLSGSDKGNQDYIRKIVDLYELADAVLFTGFVSNEEMYTFYKNAIALVMPTFLGPTNMPILEAYHLGCSVLCSDLEGHREQVGDYATYFDPRNYQEITQKMLYLASSNNTFNKSKPIQNQNTATIIEQHLLDLLPIRKTFGYDF